MKTLLVHLMEHMTAEAYVTFDINLTCLHFKVSYFILKLLKIWLSKVDSYIDQSTMYIYIYIYI